MSPPCKLRLLSSRIDAAVPLPVTITEPDTVNLAGVPVPAVPIPTFVRRTNVNL